MNRSSGACETARDHQTSERGERATMKLWSESWTNGDAIPARHAAGKLDDAGAATFADDVNPHLAWSELPAGTRSLVLICHDFDVPSRPDDVNKADREIPADLPRVDFL